MTNSVGASLPGAAPKSSIAAFRAEWEVFRHAPFGAPVGFVERLLAALEANAPDPFVLVGMEGRDDDEAHAAMLAADCAAWLAENPREYPFSTTKFAEKLVRLGWRAMWRGAALEAGPSPQNDKLFQRVRHALWTWGQHKTFCHYKAPQYDDDIETDQGTPCDCGLHAELEASRGVRGESLLPLPGLDACQLCHGRRGGVPGNENIVKIAGLDVTVCDYCHAALQ